jgi:tetratricopeptide (TPR) repeat protein
MARLHESLQQAEALAETLGDQRRLGLIAAFMTQGFVIMGHLDRAAESGRRALALATARDDGALRILANYYLGQVCFLQGNPREAIDAFGRNVADLQGDRLRERLGMGTYPAVTSRSQLAWNLAELGQFGEAGAIAAEALRLAETLDHPYSLTMASWNAAIVHLLQGSFQPAVLLCERAVDLCRVHEIPRMLTPSVVCLGSAYAGLGRRAAAVPLLEQGAVLVPSYSATSFLTRELAGAYFAIGQPVQAGEIAARGLAVAARQGERGLEAWLVRLLGELAAQADPPDWEAAATHYGRALVRAEEFGMRPLVAHCHLGLGKLYRRTGKREQAREHLATAVTMYREMDMGVWLEKVESAIKEAT